MDDQKKQILSIISNETKSSIDQLPIVTPSVYASIFSEYAKEHDASLDDEHTLAQDVLNIACSNLTTLQGETSKNANLLSSNTQKAIHAIQAKDEESLSEVLKETQSLKEEIEKLKEAIYKDELTNVFNRKWLHDNLLMSGENNFKEAGTLVMIDLNYFKQINDTYGHIVGDKVLIFIANALKKSRSNVVRYGGDEFLVLFHHNVSLQAALKTLETIREDILKKKLKSGDDAFRVSFSLGATAFKKGDALNKVIEDADKNMYHDKVEIKKRVTGI